MTDITKTMEKKYNAMMQQAHKQMDEWRQALPQLAQEIHELPAEIRVEYEQKLAMLNLHWQQVESEFAGIELAEQEKRADAYDHWRETAVAYDEAFLDTTHHLKEKELVPLGWLQGFTDKRTRDSQGWAEGMDHKGEVKSKS